VCVMFIAVNIHEKEECGHYGLLVLKDELTSFSCLFLTLHGGS
jgi:hypothetical protein